MITKKDEKFIKKYVDETYFDTEKLIGYLNIHDFVGPEIFEYCDRKCDDMYTCLFYLMDKNCYKVTDTKTFVRRIPFYFFTKQYSDHEPGSLSDIFQASKEAESGYTEEELLSFLEHALYDLEISLVDIFRYWINQQDGDHEFKVFTWWMDYVSLCEAEGSKNYFPKRLITAYNQMLEAAGREPVIHCNDITSKSLIYYRDGVRVCFEDRFPCDEGGNPIMKWIGLKIQNAAGISCTCEHSEEGELWVELTPKSTVHILSCDQDGNDTWAQVYTGPQLMEYDYTALKLYRKRQGFTQQEVADAVGTSVRTYQKWECGETTPDGCFLLRLMNWLGIGDIQDIIKYIE